MTGGEMAFMALVLFGFTAFAVVLFSVSGGFRGQAPTSAAPASDKLPAGGAKAGA
jgi:hypothetical protein